MIDKVFVHFHIMSFSRFGLLRSRPRLLGGLTRAGMNGMPLVHQRFSGTGDGTGGGNFSRYFDGVGTINGYCLP